jgi:FkbM family methyltransferase
MGYDIFDTVRGKFLLSTEHDLVSDQIKAGQFWEHELEPVFNTITKDMVIVEVGAYVGDHTVDLAKRCSWIYAFEGKRSTFYQLGANLLLNGISNATIYNMCVGSGDRIVTGGIPDPGNIAAYLYKTNQDSGELAHSLDTILELDRLDFLKIDVEGMDLEVMWGAENLISTHRPRIVYEYSWPLSIQKHEEYESFLKNLGYTTTKLGGEWNWLATPL